MKNNCQLYNNLIDILEGHGIASRPHEVEMATSITQKVAMPFGIVRGIIIVRRRVNLVAKNVCKQPMLFTTKTDAKLCRG